ncbi:response regulator [Cohnella lupini]|uniref:Two-component system response regulator YesN n=1 Tax=Cohnella lupini TaxID=1294267 RepID=A0A3D9IS99_9BACL|nr:response regulator [Cohnella lupini]RED64650.1 two-component system response regulator YesN [Cohnella lupini]
MRTLLIADDEQKIRLGLRAMIEREFADSYEIVLVSDGDEALAACKSTGADILITDIRMPGMDGVTLIKRLSDMPNKPAILILSGFDDFQYAKEAIRHDVKEYLLKPIVREELFAALRRIEGELERKEQIHDRLEESNQYREALRTSTLNGILAKFAMEEDEVSTRCSEVGLDEFEPVYYVGIVYGEHGKRERFNGEAYLQRTSEERGWKWLGLEDRDGQIVIVSDQLAIFEGLLEYSIASGTEGIRIGLSGKGEKIGRIKACYEEAKQALKYRMLLDQSHSGLILYDGIRERKVAYVIPKETIRKLANMLGTDREKEMKALLLEVLDTSKLCEFHIGYLEGIVKALNELVFDQVFHSYGEASIEIFKMYKKAGNVYNFAGIRDYYHSVENLLLSLNDYIRSIKAIHIEHKEMSKAVQYIHEHYHQDLSMAIVSNYVSLNYSYFSECFKEFTGESFVNFLKKVRIDQAKKLLETTDDKVYEISKRVGFENPKQFNRVFREMVGVSAMEFRDNKLSHRLGGTS